MLLLVLPLRCINSKHLGGADLFDQLLRGLGLKELLPKRCTPRLVFFILGKVERSEGASTAVQPQNNSKETEVTDSTAQNNAWRKSIKKAIAQHMSSGALKQFSKDYSDVPPTEFSLSLPLDLIPSSSLR